MNINQREADRLHEMRNELTEKAMQLIATTDFNIVYDVFGGMTADEINKMVEEWV